MLANLHIIPGPEAHTMAQRFFMRVIMTYAAVMAEAAAETVRDLAAVEEQQRVFRHRLWREGVLPASRGRRTGRRTGGN